MSNKNKALSAGIGYTIGNILIKGINFYQYHYLVDY